MSKMIENRVRRYSNKDLHDYLGELLGPKYTEYRNAWNSAGPEAIPTFPIHLDIELADRCNKKCVFCPRHIESHPHFRGKTQTGMQIDADVLKRVVEECRTKPLYAVNFGFGSEPLLCSNLIDLLDDFHSTGVVDSWIITNGVLLQKWIDRILDSSLTSLYVSIDAVSEETYRKLRGGGFNKVVSAVLEILEKRAGRGSRLPVVRVSFIDHPDNRHEMDAFLRFWEDKVDFIDVQTFFDYQNTDMSQVGAKRRNCLDPFRRLCLRGNSVVIPCASEFGIDLQMGNIAEQSLEEIWHGAKLNKVREDLRDGANLNCEFCQGT